MVVVRGDHRVNDIKLANALGAQFRPAREDEFAERVGPAGYIGPVGIDVPILLDDAVEPGAYITGANRENAHLKGVEPGRDFAFKRGDVRSVEAGDTVDGHEIRIEPAIEVGNIFKLGTRFSEPLGATYLDESGKAQPIWMGSYGIGPARITAAAVEQFADENGISWPRAIAPFDLHLVGLGKADSEERAIAEKLYDELRETGLRVLYDDRDAGPGEKFADAELLGVPVRLTVGRRTLANGEVEVQVRRGSRGPHDPARGRRGRGRRALADRPVAEAAEKARLTFRRLSGLDRSGPPPPQTLKGAPLHPWTIPNAIGYIRLALIPVFLVIAFSSGDGQDWRAATDLRLRRLERLLRRYRRPPDRPVLAPRRAARPARRPPARAVRRHRLLALRPAAALGAGAAGGARAVHALPRPLGPASRGGHQGQLARPAGHLAGALRACSFAMAGLETAGEIFFYVGLAMALASTVKYVRDGLASRPSSTG